MYLTKLLEPLGIAHGCHPYRGLSGGLVGKLNHCVFLMFFVLFYLCCPLCASAISGRQLLVVTQSTQLLQGTASSGSNSSGLPAGTVVIGNIVEVNAIGQSGNKLYEIATTEEHPRVGRVSSSFVMPLSAYAFRLVEQRTQPAEESPAKLLYRPWLIRFQENPSVFAAWQKVNELIASNQQLPEDQELADPYFARAELWAAVENYADAIQDYITGINILKARGASPDNFLKYVEKLSLAVRNLEANPVPAIGARLGWAEAALEHYKLGYTAYFMRDYEKCLIHFSNSVAMDPQKPHYWYFRALAHRGLGNDQQAQHDALLGARFEQQLAADAVSINQRLFRVQGATRTWLEKFRNGLMAFHLLGPSKVALNSEVVKTMEAPDEQ